MKRVSFSNIRFIVMGLLFSAMPSFAAVSDELESQKKERSRFKQFTGWLRDAYGSPRADARILWSYVNKKVRFQKVDKKLSAQAWSIMKRYGIPLGVLLIVGGVGVKKMLSAKKAAVEEEKKRKEALRQDIEKIGPEVKEDLFFQMVPTEKTLESQLFGAINSGGKNLAIMLIDKGVDVNAKIWVSQGTYNERKFADTMLQYAVLEGKKDMVKLFLQNGASIDSKNKKNGRTALMIAIDVKHPEIVLSLLEAGASLDTKDNMDDKTAYDLATPAMKKVIDDFFFQKKARKELSQFLIIMKIVEEEKDKVDIPKEIKLQILRELGGELSEEQREIFYE